MPAKSTLIAAVAFIAAGAGLSVAGAGGQSTSDDAPPGKLARCDAPQEDFDAGASVQGVRLTHRDALCTQADPERSQSAGGGIDPDSYTRAHYTLAVYGTCEATSDTGCAPPLQIQTWPACERSPADYSVGGKPLAPTEVLNIRGVPARFYGANRLEISAGDVTVVMFGDSREILINAAAALRTRPGSPRAVGADQMLPAPVPGAEDGTLSC